MISSASRSVASGGRVIGSTIIPDCERLTLSTSAAWSSGDRLRWMMPSPPSRARAIARRASVTVSMAAESSGMFRRMPGVSWALTSVWSGSTSV